MERLKFGAIDKNKAGAEEGTRTPTPLRVHGPEPCASANSATSALNEAPDQNRRLRREILLYFKGFAEGVKSAGDREIGTSGHQDIAKSGDQEIRVPGNRVNR